jgi:hypothetical protein
VSDWSGCYRWDKTSLNEIPRTGITEKLIIYQCTGLTVHTHAFDLNANAFEFSNQEGLKGSCYSFKLYFLL